MASTAPRVRPNSVLESVPAVPIPGSIVPEKDTKSDCQAAFGAILVAEKIQFSEAESSQMVLSCPLRAPRSNLDKT
jgi:hypothetical protein